MSDFLKAVFIVLLCVLGTVWLLSPSLLLNIEEYVAVYGIILPLIVPLMFVDALQLPPILAAVIYAIPVLPFFIMRYYGAREEGSARHEFWRLIFFGNIPAFFVLGVITPLIERLIL